MKQRITTIFLLVLFLTFALPGAAMAKGLQDDRIVAGGTFTLPSGETQDGNLLIFGGVVTLEQGSQVNGDVVLMGGTIDINGEVSGSVVGIGSAVRLGGSAVVNGDLTTLAASLHRAEGSVVAGQVITGFQGPLVFPGPGKVVVPEIPNFPVRFPTIWSGIWALFRTFLWGALAVLVVMFLPRPTERVARTIITQPLAAGGVGLLTVIVAPLMLVILAITLILIPVSLLGVIILVVAWFFGHIAIGYEVGRRLGIALGQDWPLAVAAGIGTFLVTLISAGIDQLVFCIGWTVPFLIGILGLGGVILTRFGSQAYPPPAFAGPVNPPLQPGPRVPSVPAEPARSTEGPNEPGSQREISADV